MATEIVRPGGHVANVGVHGKPVELALNQLWISNITISMGLVNTNTLGMLLKLVAQRALPAHAFVTHEFTFDQVDEAYDVFGNAAEHDALKVLIHDGPRLLGSTSDRPAPKPPRTAPKRSTSKASSRFAQPGEVFN